MPIALIIPEITKAVKHATLQNFVFFMASNLLYSHFNIACSANQGKQHRRSFPVPLFLFEFFCHNFKKPVCFAAIVAVTLAGIHLLYFYILPS